MKIKRGFTLIELLVVIATISMLASVILVGMQNARNRAVVAKISLDFRSISTALEMYYNDNGSYPSWSGISGVTTVSGGHWDYLATALQPYMPALPTPSFPSTIVGGLISQGFAYYKGAPHSGVSIPIYNSIGGNFVACILIYDGYYLTALSPGGQSALTLNDGGPDPDAVDTLRAINGKVVISTTQSDCAGGTNGGNFVY